MINYNLKDYAQKARQAVAEGVVMLENNNVLPITGKKNIALFGRTQFNYYKSGTGSGGLVNTRYVTGIYEALEADDDITVNTKVRKAYEQWIEDHPFDMGQGWAQEPWFQEEMPIDSELVDKAKEESDIAVVIIGRTAGEDKDNKAEEGSYLLTSTEIDMLDKVCGAFKQTIVLLNVGNIIDMKSIRKANPSAILYVWQGGQEGGNGVLDVLKGNVSPSGRLADTIAYDIEDYYSTKYHGDKVRNYYVEDIYVGYRYFETFAKEKVMYPFGYGLSYTGFDRKVTDIEENKFQVDFKISVKNTGDVAGKEAVLMFVEAPQGKLGKASRSLVNFAKSELLQPGEEDILSLTCYKYFMASYDDSGVTGHKSAYVLEAGEYKFYLGGDVREAVLVGSIVVPDTVVIEQLQEAMAPVMEFEKLKPVVKDGVLVESLEKVPLRTIDIRKRRNDNMPKEVPYTGDRGFKLIDVKNKKVSMEEFIAQFEIKDLMAIARGEGMSPADVTPGIAGAFGGVTDKHRHFGIPKAGCSDGPSGIRMDCGTKAFAMPNGTCLACTFNQKLSEELYEYEGMELRINKVDTLLGPGMNIHRNPLNGRNFEYFSEDPIVTGFMSAAQLKGMHKYGVTGTIKHFACNNQEFNRAMVDSIVSERALREIYLKGYEIVVKQTGAYLVMTSYNRINNMHAASNYDLNTTILRGEWGFDGAVMTDWWAQGNEEDGPSVLKHTAVMIAAQNDIFMVMPDAGKDSATDTTKEGLDHGLVTVAELQRTAKNVCNVVMRLPVIDRFNGNQTEIDKAIANISTEDGETAEEMVLIGESKEEGVFNIEPIDTTKGTNNIYLLKCGGGEYHMEITLKATGGNELAQIPVSIFKDRGLVKTITLTGADTEYRTEKLELGAVLGATSFIKLYFGQSGMDIESVKVIRDVTHEELLKKIEQRRQSGEAF
ncbi:MAG: glycoside hydrolase family 3 protein [Lachnospiraceae bacterium]|nr:glycoside hydrolase family 3 protein [Lachnospiraceae bacterium]